jgi:sterol desaturase/sphingolipid hydroxylase (fatty acid hydroxylase superfamily)
MIGCYPKSLYLLSDQFHNLFSHIVIDFYGYWNHRIAHQVNFFGMLCITVVAKNSTLLTLRQSISFIIFFTFTHLFLLLWWSTSKSDYYNASYSTVLQFWYHTNTLKNGVLEHILVTPSHHRVHHTINEYIDKIILRDLLFGISGTFQEELEPYRQFWYN